jgi:hypothetical protein
VGLQRRPGRVAAVARVGLVRKVGPRRPQRRPPVDRRPRLAPRVGVVDRRAAHRPLPQAVVKVVVVVAPPPLLAGRISAV